MPSPIAHLAAGYIVYRAIRPAAETEDTEDTTATPAKLSLRLASLPLLATTLTLSLLPDIDVIPGFATGDLGRFHNQATNSLLFALTASLGVGLLCRVTGWAKFRTGFLLTLGLVLLHIAMDAATMGRGVKLLWPFSHERFSAPVRLFYGLHWSEGWVSAKHITTVVTELATVAVAGALLLTVKRRRNRTQPSPHA